MITIYPSKLKCGDMVNGHEIGWLHCIRVAKTWIGFDVIFHAPLIGKNIIVTYRKDELIDVIRGHY